MPWVKYSTPDKFPHIAHFVTAPAFKGKGYARETLGYAEELLKTQFKTPAVTLGTAKEHPWLPKMYESCLLYTSFPILRQSLSIRM